ncbi:Nucleoporin SEH1 [Rhodotorula toruloides]|uniref:WD40-repeat-containing domain protein n=1 Tax=Rhodotorula toruloides TaxID=5286 RepID=A0A2S9ZWD0_RHOTO|nr:Nucleoporin SEH1 [Rhodotorula toruloides]PRQ70054.1 WD40-repeat-containing domain protein [Rhodotorula toruloides]
MAGAAEIRSSTLPSPHFDLLTDIAFSPLASHLATASLDHHVRVQHPSGGANPTWDHATRAWKAHDGPALCLAWADPEFGTVLASGGVDGVVKVWREDEPPPRAGAGTAANGHHPFLPSPRPHGTPGHPRTPSAPPAGAHSGWSLTAQLTDCRGTIRSVSFAPAHFGLKLAGVSSDSHLRVWECLDPTLALREWTLREDVDLAVLGLGPSVGSSAGAAQGGSASASAGQPDGTVPFPSTSSSVGSAGNPSSSGFPTVSSAASSSSVSVDGRGGFSAVSGAGNARAGGTVESDGGWSVSWFTEHWWGERLAVTSGTNGVIRLFHFPSGRPWSNFLNLLPSRLALSQPITSSSPFPHGTSTPTDESHHANPNSSAFSHTSSSSASASDYLLPSGSSASATPTAATHTPPVSSLAFAPPSGRSFLLLASGSRDGRARVWRITPPPLELANAGGGDADSADGEWSARLEVELDSSATLSGGAGGEAGKKQGSGLAGGSSPALAVGLGGAMSSCRVAWNVLGTVLSTSGGEDGKVRVWKPTYTGQWRLLAVLGTEDTPENGQDGQ